MILLSFFLANFNVNNLFKCNPFSMLLVLDTIIVSSGNESDA